MSDEPELTLAPLPTATADEESPGGGGGRRSGLWYLIHVLLPVSTSVILHLGIVGFLGLKTFHALSRPKIDLGEWEGTVVEAEELSDAFQWTDDNVLETPDESVVDYSSDYITDFQAVSDFDPGGLDLSNVGSGIGDADGLGLGEGALSLIGTGSGAAAPGSGGFGPGLGGGGARIGQAGIWSLSIRADTVVYVVDFSGSIIVAVDELKRELKRSIGRLTSAQKFNVIVFYSSGGGLDDRVRTESFRPKLEPADKGTRLEFFRWIDPKAPMGVTEPLQAMKRALALNPDAIFFFSDGFFDDSIVAQIERANRRVRARIYCLVFDDILLDDTSGLPRETEGVRRLKRLAEGNNGKVKIVTGLDLGR